MSKLQEITKEAFQICYKKGEVAALEFLETKNLTTEEKKSLETKIGAFDEKAQELTEWNAIAQQYAKSAELHKVAHFNGLAVEAKKELKRMIEEA